MNPSRLQQHSGPRRVLVDASKLTDSGMDGIKRYALELLRSMSRIERQYSDLSIEVSFDGMSAHPLTLVAPYLEDQAALRRLPTRVAPPVIPEKKSVRGAARIFHELHRFQARMRRIVWKRVRRFQSRPFEFDLVHLTLPSTWRLYESVTARRLVTVHDLSHVVCPQFQTASNCQSLYEGLTAALRTRSQFLAVSHSTAREFAEYSGLPHDEIPVIHEACNRNVFRAESRDAKRRSVREKYGIPPGPLVLTLSKIEPRKNTIGVVRACQQVRQSFPDFRFTLVLAGSLGWGDHSDLQREISRSDWIRQIGHIDDSDLAVLYSDSTACCCVSFYEGFCLPALEALSCGCPVIHSDNSALPEVVRDAGLPADPNDISTIATQIRRLLTDERLAGDLRRRALKRSEDFSWDSAARRTIDAYRDCLDRPATQASPGVTTHSEFVQAGTFQGRKMVRAA